MAVNVCSFVEMYRCTSNNILKRFLATSARSVSKGLASHQNTDHELEWNKAKSFDQIPGPKRIPLLGSTWEHLPVVGKALDMTKLLELNENNHAKYGPIWRERPVGMADIVTTVEPADAEVLFRNEVKYPERPGFSVLKQYRTERPHQFISTGILGGNGEDWWNTRSKAQQTLLKPKNVNNYIPVLSRISDDFIARIRHIRPENNEMAPNFVNEMYRWALESVGVVAFNTRLGCLEPDLAPDSEAMKMIQATNLSFRAFNELELAIPAWKLFKTPLLRQVYEAQDFLTELETCCFGSSLAPQVISDLHMINTIL